MRDSGDGEGHLCIVGIGASAGGLEAIREMLASADPGANLAYVLIQHLDPNHESLLAELLGRHTALEVHQARDGQRVERGGVYIIPPGHGLTIVQGRLRLNDFAMPRGLRRPIDDFFESLAADKGTYATCVILSGTGGDGSAGLRAIKEHGGLCIAQDPETARYEGMPLAAQATGLVDFVRAPDRIVETIAQFYAHKSLSEGDEGLGRTVEESVADLCRVLRRSCGHDFTGYKRSTLIRRIQRRIQVLGLDSAGEYLQRLGADPGECEKLFCELLINVTRFFRDSEHFERLRALAVAPLVREAEDEVRVWVPGCSSGEEVYSLAMLFAEEVRHQQRTIDVQIFATDIDERMLGLARRGIYPLSALVDIPEPMRERYVIGREGQFRISGQVRDMIRFSTHNLVRDPPFAHIDLLSCRNLLIYFGERLQGEVASVFYYALRPRGRLFLGPSETLGRSEHLFETVDQRARLFQRREGGPAPVPPLRRTGFAADPSWRSEPPQPALRSGRRKAALERLTERYAPPSLQVTASGEILSSTGELGRYLALDPSRRERPSAQALARPGLREEVSAAIRQAAGERRRCIVRDLTAQSERGTQAFDLVADPLPDGTLLLVFRDRAPFQALTEDELDEVELSDSRVQDLEEELRSTRARLHTTVEELEIANEELKSSNEEMMSMNEELQSTNEELATVNDELKSKVDQLAVANADLMNFFASTALPLVVLDGHMRIRSFTEAILSIYPFRGGDHGRPLREVTSHLEDGEVVLAQVEQVMRTGEVRAAQVRERDGPRTWKLLVTPYRTREGESDGCTLVFSDITDALRLHDELAHESERLRLALEVTRLGVWEYEPAAGRLTLDDTGAAHLALAAGGDLTVERLLTRCAGDDRVDVEAAFAAAGRSGDVDVTFQVRARDGGSRILRAVGRRASARTGGRIFGVLFDVTSEIEAARLRDLMLREMDHRVKNTFAIIMSLVRGVGRSVATPGELVQGVETRIEALARSHDLTQRGALGQHVSLAEAAQASLLPYEGQAPVSVSGPPLEVTRSELTPLSLILHEWATNAAKYGVFGPRPGRLDVSWRRDGPGSVELVWSELYDEARAAAEGAPGFGSTLASISAMQLGGSIETEIGDAERRMRLRFATRT